MANALLDRMARTKRQQSRALAGELGPMPDVAANDGAGRSRNEPHSDPRVREAMLQEFEGLLPVISSYYGYEAADIDAVRAAVSASNPSGRIELELCVRQWRIDAVTNCLEGLPDEVRTRAWIQFRQSVMGANADELGVPYAFDALLPKPQSQQEGAAD